MASPAACLHTLKLGLRGLPGRERPQYLSASAGQGIGYAKLDHDNNWHMRKPVLGTDAAEDVQANVCGYGVHTGLYESWRW